MPGKQRAQISVQIEEDYLASFGFGSAGFLRHNGLDVEFLSGVNWNGNIDTTSPRSRDQHIDELAYSIITGEEAPQTPSPKNRRSRSEEPRRVNQESLTLEDRMGPKARFRVRSNGWRPLKSIGGEGEEREALPPAPTPPEDSLDVREATGFSQGISEEYASMNGSISMTANHSFFPDRSPTGASCRSQDSWAVPTPPRRQSYCHEPYSTNPQAYPEGLISPSAESSFPSRSCTGESNEVRPVDVSSFGTQPVRAWRYGRGSWYSVMECTVELKDATITVRREGVVQQRLSCASIVQAVKYGAQKRLIIAAAPGEDSMFLSLDKEVQSLLLRAFAHYGISVSTAGYMEFHALQKQLVFPGAPVSEAPPSPKKAAVPTQVAKQVGATSDAAGVQAEISAQLDALRSQQQELARLEAQLLQLRTVAA